jgi:hypothetical protein
MPKKPQQNYALLIAIQTLLKRLPKDPKTSQDLINAHNLVMDYKEKQEVANKQPNLL